MSKSKIVTSSKTKTEMGAAARVTTAPGPVLSCVYRLIEMVLLAHFRVAGLGRLSAGAKMAMKPFVKRVFTIFATNASFLRVISNFRI